MGDLSRSDRFHLEIEGISAATFHRCEGLESRVEVVGYREGGHGGVRLFADRESGGRLLLERGLSRDRSLRDWYERGDPRCGAVVLLGEKGEEKARWSFREGWPCRWEGPLLSSSEGGIAIETIEIVHEGLQWEVR